MQNDTERDDRSKVPYAHTGGRAINAEYVGRTHTERIRAEIEAGTFETPERIDGTVDAMLEQLWDRR
jgi:hypothetical protein